MMKNLYIILILLISPAIQSNEHKGQIDDSDLLRTLFTTEQLRYQLDQLRNQGKYSDKAQARAGGVRKPVKIKLQGAVFRDNKTPVIFINNKSTLQSPVISDHIIIDSESTRRKNYQVPVRINKKYISLKPGQQWDESKKEVQDSYLINPVETVRGSSGVTSGEASGNVNSGKK